MLESNNFSTADLCEKVLPAIFRINWKIEDGSKSSWGTGFFIKNDGTAVTAYHVIIKNGNCSAVLQSGKEYPIKIVNFDCQSDFALIKVQTPDPVPFIPLGDYDKVRLGDQVFSLGLCSYSPKLPEIKLCNILQLNYKSNLCIACDTNSTTIWSKCDTIVTNCTARPGNSGGPLVNMKGEAIGILSTKTIRKDSNLIDYVSMYTRANVAKKYIEEMNGVSYLNKSHLGMSLKKNYSGFVISTVLEGLPADKAGLKNGDVILKVNGKTFKDYEDLFEEVPKEKAVALNIVFMRNGTKIETTLFS